MTVGKGRDVQRTVGGLGEWGFLSRLLPHLSTNRSGQVLLGPGDDAALLRVGKEAWAVTTDMLVENVHFRLRWTPPLDLGHKVLAVNLSDLAAMGDVTPVAGVLSAGVPRKTSVRFLDQFYSGFNALAQRWGLDLVGGDTVRADRMVFSLTVMGRVRGRVLCRQGARPGDVLMVSGTLGDAAAGLAVLEKNKNPFSPMDRWLAGRLRRPEPRLKEARILARQGQVTAGMDISDGLWRSVRLMAEASSVGAEVWADQLPFSPALRRWAGPRVEDWALMGGEDYELLAAVAPLGVAALKRRGFTAVGRVTEIREGVRVLSHGIKREVRSGFEHFDR